MPSGIDSVCDVCGEKEEAILTKHHYTRREKSKLKIKKDGRKWIYRCANCHMAFNKLGVKQFYAPGGYYDTHRVVREPNEEKDI